MFNNLFFKKSSLVWDNIEKCDTASEAIHGNIMRRRKDAICLPDNQGKNTDTCSHNF